MSTEKQRRVVHVVSEDAVDGAGGRALLWAFGRRWLARASGMSVNAWKLFVRRKDIQEGRPLLVVAALLESREAELGADAIAGAKALRRLDDLVR